MSNDKFNLIKRINSSIVREDGSIDSFEKQVLNLTGGVFDTRFPLIVSVDSHSINYFEPNVEKPIIMRAQTAIKIREKHDIGWAFVGQCLDLLRGSSLAFDSLTQPTSRVVLLDVNNDDGDPYIAVCRTDNTVHTVEINEITSVYDKQNFERFIARTYDKGKTFYKNDRTIEYIKTHNLSLPSKLAYALSDAYDRSIFNKDLLEQDILKIPKAQRDALFPAPSLAAQIASSEHPSW